MHYVLGGGSLFALVAALFFWFPKMFGIKLDERMGKWSFWLMLLGFNATFLPMHFMGIEGMPRRVFTYPAMGDLGWLNLLASIGAGIMALAVVVIVANVVISCLAREPVADDPWGGGFSLEWATSSPPPEFNFDKIPPIRSERPVWDMLHVLHIVILSSVRVRTRVEGRIVRTFIGLFFSSAAFGLAAAIIYWFSSHEYAGTLLLGLMTVALSFAAGYAMFAERESHLVGDDPKLTPIAASGEDLGIVTKQSAWPIVLAFTVLWSLIGLIWSDFMLFTGVAALLLVLWRLGAESSRTSHRRIPTIDGPSDVT